MLHIDLYCLLIKDVLHCVVVEKALRRVANSRPVTWRTIVSVESRLSSHLTPFTAVYKCAMCHVLRHCTSYNYGIGIITDEAIAVSWKYWNHVFYISFEEGTWLQNTTEFWWPIVIRCQSRLSKYLELNVYLVSLCFPLNCVLRIVRCEHISVKIHCDRVRLSTANTFIDYSQALAISGTAIGLYNYSYMNGLQRMYTWLFIYVLRAIKIATCVS